MLKNVINEINNRFENEDCPTKEEVLKLLLKEIENDNQQKVDRGVLSNNKIPKRETLMSYLRQMDLDSLLRKCRQFLKWYFY